MSAGFFINGLSFIDFHFRKTGLWAIVRVILYFVALVILSLFLFINPVILLVILGLTDSNSDYRKIRHVDQNENM